MAHLIYKGVEPIFIKERLGHKDIKITLNTYGHLYPNQRRKIANLLDSEYIKSPGSTEHQDCVISEDESSNINLRQVDYNKDSNGAQSPDSIKGGD